MYPEKFGIMTFSLMRKLFFIFIFPALLFAQNANCKSFNERQDSPQQQISKDELSFEQIEFYYHDEGDVPVPQIFFNNFPNPANSFSSNLKSRETFLELLYSRTNIICKLSNYQASVFGWHSSALIQLYLKTACFRL